MVFLSRTAEGVVLPEPIADPGKEETEADCPGTGSRTGDAAVEGIDNDSEGDNIAGEG